VLWAFDLMQLNDSDLRAVHLRTASADLVT
jgi:hypothetical protein